MKELIINPTTRMIEMDKKSDTVGVYHDNNSDGVAFRVSGEIVSVLKNASNVYINYKFAGIDDVYRYTVKDLTVEGNTLTFSWILDYTATQNPGKIYFIACFKFSDDSEWNTTVATGTILDGIEPEMNDQEMIEIQSFYDQLVQQLTEIAANAGGGTGSYILPVATSSTLGGVKPVAKTTGMTQQVGVDTSGRLYTAPGQTPVDAYTKAESDDRYQPKGEYLTEHQSLDGYAKTSDIPEKLPNPYALTINGVAYDGSEAKNITVTGGGDPIEIDAYTKAESDSKYQPKGDYLTEHQSLDGYATDEEVSDAVSGLVQKLNALNVNAVRGKRILWIGDSWTYGQGVDASQRFSALVSNSLGMVEDNRGIPGTGFLHLTTFLTQITNAYESMTEEQVNDTKLIFIFGGLNDWNHFSEYGLTNTQFQLKVKEVLTYAVEHFPNARVYLGSMNISMRSNLLMHTLKMYEDFAVLGMQRCALSNVSFILAGNGSYWQSDLVHPNVSGHSLLAKAIETSLLGNDFHMMKPLNPFTWESTVTSVTQNMLGFVDENGYAHIPQTVLSFTPAANTNAQKVGTLPQALRPPVIVYGLFHESNVKIAGGYSIYPNGAMYVTYNETPAATARNIVLQELTYRVCPTS